MYTNLLHLPLFNFTYLFFLLFPFLSTYLLVLFSLLYSPLGFSFIFQFVLKLVLFLTSKYTFLFPLLAGSVYCALFLLDCFYVAHGYICICVYSIILIIICLILQLPFVWGSSLISVFGWIFVTLP